MNSQTPSAVRSRSVQNSGDVVTQNDAGEPGNIDAAFPESACVKSGGEASQLSRLVEDVIILLAELRRVRGRGRSVSALLVDLKQLVRDGVVVSRENNEKSDRLRAVSWGMSGKLRRTYTTTAGGILRQIVSKKE